MPSLLPASACLSTATSRHKHKPRANPSLNGSCAYGHQHSKAWHKSSTDQERKNKDILPIDLFIVNLEPTPLLSVKFICSCLFHLMKKCFKNPGLHLSSFMLDNILQTAHYVLCKFGAYPLILLKKESRVRKVVLELKSKANNVWRKEVVRYINLEQKQPSGALL